MKSKPPSLNWATFLVVLCFASPKAWAPPLISDFDERNLIAFSRLADTVPSGSPTSVVEHLLEQINLQDSHDSSIHILSTLISCPIGSVHTAASDYIIKNKINDPLLNNRIQEIVANTADVGLMERASHTIWELKLPATLSPAFSNVRKLLKEAEDFHKPSLYRTSKEITRAIVADSEAALLTALRNGLQSNDANTVTLSSNIYRELHPQLSTADKSMRAIFAEAAHMSEDAKHRAILKPKESAVQQKQKKAIRASWEAADSAMHEALQSMDNWEKASKGLGESKKRHDELATLANPLFSKEALPVATKQNAINAAVEMAWYFPRSPTTKKLLAAAMENPDSDTRERASQAVARQSIPKNNVNAPLSKKNLVATDCRSLLRRFNFSDIQLLDEPTQ